MGIPNELSDVLSGPLEGVTRIVVRHERRRAFRWMSLLELAFFLVLCSVLLVCLVVFFVLSLVLGEGDAPLGDVELPKIRFYRYWHELVIRCQDANGAVLNELTHAPADGSEGRALIASMLVAAGRAGIVLVETLGGRASETLEVWYGGQPLLAHPEARDGEKLKATLSDAGYVIDETETRCAIRKQAEPRGRFSAFSALLLELCLLPVMFWRQEFRATLRATLQDLKGVPPTETILSIHGDRKITIHSERAGVVSQEETVDGRDLLGVAYSATLDYDRDVKRRAPTLRLVGRDATIRLPATPTHHLGRALRDMILVTAIERWEGIPATTTRPTRCPYCGTLYVLEADISCPSCGASAASL